MAAFAGMRFAVVYCMEKRRGLLMKTRRTVSTIVVFAALIISLLSFSLIAAANEIIAAADYAKFNENLEKPRVLAAIASVDETLHSAFFQANDRDNACSAHGNESAGNASLIDSNGFVLANHFVAANTAGDHYNLQFAGLEPLNDYAGKPFSNLPAPVTLLWLVFGLVGWLVAGENFVNKT